MHIVCAALLYAGLVVYGSLVPFNFRLLTVAEAWGQFADMPSMTTGRISRSDVAVNFMLLVPLSFLAMSSLCTDRRGMAAVPGALAVVPACFLLAVGCEFAQVFFPPRVSSSVDIVMQTLGALAGVALWTFCGPAVIEACRRLWRVYQARGPVGSMLIPVYLVFLLVIHAMPFDVMTSPAELYHKWRAGRVVLVPGTGSYGDFLVAVEKNSLNVACFLPVGVLLASAASRTWPRLSETRTPVSKNAVHVSQLPRGLRVLGLGMGIAAGVEAMQLWVDSRNFDVTDILTGTAAVVLGWLIATPTTASHTNPKRQRGTLVRRESPTPPKRVTEGLPNVSSGSRSHQSLRTPLLTLCLVAWPAVLATCFWWPFEFTFDPSVLAERPRSIAWMPFADWCAGNDVVSFQRIVDKTLRAAPLGILLAAVFPVVQRRCRLWPALATIFSVAVILEVGQLFLPGRYPGLTDILIVLTGGALGYWLVEAAGSPSNSHEMASASTLAPSNAAQDQTHQSPTII